MNIQCALDRICAELEGDERTVFTFAEAQKWAAEYGFSEERPAPIIQGLKARKMKMTERLPPRRVRTIGSNPHDRWQACPSHGGGGGPAISGMAGTAG